MNKIVLVSGGFDPIHSGHISLIRNASRYGDVVVLLNSDSWLKRKKGREFLPFNEREIIMNSIKNVIDVLSFNDDDSTCIDGIRKAISKYSNYDLRFANGGDRNKNNIPEQTKFISHKNIEFAFGVGGNIKINSSSWILNNWLKK